MDIFPSTSDLAFFDNQSDNFSPHPSNESSSRTSESRPSDIDERPVLEDALRHGVAEIVEPVQKTFSGVWKFHGMVQVDDILYEKFTACRLCCRVARYQGATSTMRTHLQNFHPQEFAWLCAEEARYKTARKDKASCHINGVSGVAHKSSRPLPLQRPCGICNGCLSPKCGHCKYCVDSPEFGGLGQLAQPCIQQRCLVLLEKSLQQDADILSPQYGCGGCAGCLALDCGVCAACVDHAFFGGTYLRGSLCRAKRCIRLATSPLKRTSPPVSKSTARKPQVRKSALQTAGARRLAEKPQPLSRQKKLTPPPTMDDDDSRDSVESWMDMLEPTDSDPEFVDSRSSTPMPGKRKSSASGVNAKRNSSALGKRKAFISKEKTTAKTAAKAPPKPKETPEERRARLKAKRRLAKKAKARAAAEAAANASQEPPPGCSEEASTSEQCLIRQRAEEQEARFAFLFESPEPASLMQRVFGAFGKSDAPADDDDSDFSDSENGTAQAVAGKGPAATTTNGNLSRQTTSSFSCSLKPTETSDTGSPSKKVPALANAPPLNLSQARVVKAPTELSREGIIVSLNMKEVEKSTTPVQPEIKPPSAPSFPAYPPPPPPLISMASRLDSLPPLRPAYNMQPQPPTLHKHISVAASAPLVYPMQQCNPTLTSRHPTIPASSVQVVSTHSFWTPPPAPVPPVPMLSCIIPSAAVLTNSVLAVYGNSAPPGVFRNYAKPPAAAVGLSMPPQHLSLSATPIRPPPPLKPASLPICNAGGSIFEDPEHLALQNDLDEFYREEPSPTRKYHCSQPASQTSPRQAGGPLSHSVASMLNGEQEEPILSRYSLNLS